MLLDLADVPKSTFTVHSRGQDLASHRLSHKRRFEFNQQEKFDLLYDLSISGLQLSVVRNPGP